MLRKLLRSTMMLSMVGSLIVGSALAWTSTAQTSGSATAGSIAFSIFGLAPTSAKVVPDGNARVVATGGINNSGDIGVKVTGGSVTNFSLTGLPNASNCWDDLSGAVAVTNPGVVQPAQNNGNLYDVSLTMGVNAEDACQGATINYDLTINVTT